MNTPIFPSTLRPRARRGFSLVEVLLAVFILGIGMIMVAAIFPVGADWTRQNAEETVGAIVARNAQAIIQAKLTPAAVQNVPADFSFVPLPGLTDATLFPLAERAYDFGQSPAYPANPTRLDTSNGRNVTPLYFWTAIIRRSPTAPPVPPTSPYPAYEKDQASAIPPAPIRYDLYIFVCKKGDADETFKTLTISDPTGTYFNVVPLPPSPSVPWYGCRGPTSSSSNPVTPNPPMVPDEVSVPCVQMRTYPLPIVGARGVGIASGTVFRQGGNSKVYPALSTDPKTNQPEKVFWVPPSDGYMIGTTPSANATSPLIYIYQTSLTF